MWVVDLESWNKILVDSCELRPDCMVCINVVSSFFLLKSTLKLKGFGYVRMVIDIILTDIMWYNNLRYLRRLGCLSKIGVFIRNRYPKKEIHVNTQTYPTIFICNILSYQMNITNFIYLTRPLSIAILFADPYIYLYALFKCNPCNSIIIFLKASVHFSCVCLLFMWLQIYHKNMWDIAYKHI